MKKSTICNKKKKKKEGIKTFKKTFKNEACDGWFLLCIICNSITTVPLMSFVLSLFKKGLYHL